MKMFLPAIRAALFGLLSLSASVAQPEGPQTTNPLVGNERAIVEGHEIYNRTCTVCHGLNGAAGDRGPALGGGRSYVIDTDAAIFDTVQNGIPATAMPASGLSPMDIWKVVAYIRSLRATASEASVPGDPANGARVFWNDANCGACHMIRGRGGIPGPDLSNIGGEQTLANIRDALTKPRLRVPRGYQPVEILTIDGRRLSGIAKNDNNFSLQLLDSHGRLQLFTSDELREVTYKQQSLMATDYDKTLTPTQFQDLLAFLSRQLVHKPEHRRRNQEDEQ